MSKSSAQQAIDTFLDGLVEGVETAKCIGTLLTGKACDAEHSATYPTCKKCAKFYCRSCEQDIRADKAVRDFLVGINKRVEMLDKEDAQTYITRVYAMLADRRVIEDDKGSRRLVELPVPLYRTRKGQILHFDCVTRYAAEQEALRPVSGPF